MQRAEFMQTLAEERFEDVVTVQREANGALDSHAHPFEAKALILEGELVIRTDGVDHVYRAGDVFHLLAQVVHIERYGPEGVKYLVGRKTIAEEA